MSTKPVEAKNFGYVIEGPDDDEDSSVNTPPMNFNQNFGSQIHTESSSYWPSSSEASYALDSIVHEDDAQMTEVGMALEKEGIVPAAVGDVYDDFGYDDHENGQSDVYYEEVSTDVQEWYSRSTQNEYAPEDQYLPVLNNGQLSAAAKEFWFPESRNCSCCKGFKHGCSCTTERHMRTCFSCAQESK